MIRLFAPPTHDEMLHRDPVTAANLLLHLAALVALFIPFGGEEKESLIDRLIVYLVPTPEPGNREAGIAAMSEADAGDKSGEPSTGHDAKGTTERITAGPVLPKLSSADLKIAEQAQQGDNAFSVLEVDSTVVYDPTSAAPEYPMHLMNQGIEGYAAVRYVVDSTGLVDTTTYRVITATHGDFAVAVRRALPNMHFRPAMQSGVKVRQLVEQTFRFRMATPADTTRRKPDPTPPA
jgi:TonB family protein